MHIDFLKKSLKERKHTSTLLSFSIFKRLYKKVANKRCDLKLSWINVLTQQRKAPTFKHKLLKKNCLTYKSASLFYCYSKDGMWSCHKNTLWALLQSL